MKLCRFELVSDPGVPRSGLVYEGKIYETDGANAVGIHEVSDTRLLSPVGSSGAFRLFRKELGPGFIYLNSAALIGPNDAFEPISPTDKLFAIPAIAVVVSEATRPEQPYQADDAVLGLALGTVFFTGNGESTMDYDVGFAVGPAVITPEELDDRVTEDELGRRYRFKMEFGLATSAMREVSLDGLAMTPAETLVLAGQTRILRPGDVFLLVGDTDPVRVTTGDETRVSAERLGVLANRLL